MFLRNWRFTINIYICRKRMQNRLVDLCALPDSLSCDSNEGKGLLRFIKLFGVALFLKGCCLWCVKDGSSKLMHQNNRK